MTDKPNTKSRTFTLDPVYSDMLEELLEYLPYWSAKEAFQEVLALVHRQYREAMELRTPYVPQYQTEFPDFKNVSLSSERKPSLRLLPPPPPRENDPSK